MHRVRKTKHPSFRQIRNMAANLKEKCGENGSIQTVLHFFNSKERFWISTESYFGFLDSWEELQAKYRDLMRRKI